MQNINTVLLVTFFHIVAFPASLSRGMVKAMAFPTANKKNGNTRSVGVQPCHPAWSKGGYMYFQLPGLFTSIIKATVAPLNTSKA